MARCSSRWTARPSPSPPESWRAFAIAAVVVIVAIAAIVYLVCTATMAQVTQACLNAGCSSVDASSKTSVAGGTTETDSTSPDGEDGRGGVGEIGGTVEQDGLCSWRCVGCNGAGPGPATRTATNIPSLFASSASHAHAAPRRVTGRH